MATEYLFTSERLGFRTWQQADLPLMAAINADPAVMEFFPALASIEETQQFIDRMNAQYAEKGFCYYAVDLLADNSFIGFIGLSEKTFEADFTPCIDIGWRLATTAWNAGYATEGAKRCLAHGFDTLGIDRICAIAPVVNEKSVHIMRKAGMISMGTFLHPLLTQNEWLKECVLYVKKKP